MTIQVEIKEFVMEFFEKIDSDIAENNGIYEIQLPEKYHGYFGSSRLLITFDKNIALQHECDLMIPGSGILSKIIINCKQRGPIRSKTARINDGKTIIRYHFFINFSGISSISKLDYVDIDLDTYKPILITNDLKNDIHTSIEKINPKNITPSYIVALEEIKKSCAELRSNFLHDANEKFLYDFTLFVKKYDSDMRDLDKSINRREETTNNPEKTQKFRFNTVEKIIELEKEKTDLIETLQEKHKVLLEYNLVACEIITL